MSADGRSGYSHDCEYSFMEACRMNAMDPFAWLQAALCKLAAGHSNRDLDALMPWSFVRSTH